MAMSTGKLEVDACDICTTPAGAPGNELDGNLTAIAQVHSKVNGARRALTQIANLCIM